MTTKITLNYFKACFRFFINNQVAQEHAFDKLGYVNSQIRNDLGLPRNDQSHENNIKIHRAFQMASLR